MPSFSGVGSTRGGSPERTEAGEESGDVFRFRKLRLFKGGSGLDINL